MMNQALICFSIVRIKNKILYSSQVLRELRVFYVKRHVLSTLRMALERIGVLTGCFFGSYDLYY